MQSLTILLSLLAVSTVTVAQSPNQACYGNVAYCAGGPIILRCSGTTLGPGNCDDNLNHPQYGTLCVQSNSTAGNAICSAIGSSPSPFPTVSGGLGTPTMSSSAAASAVSSSAAAGGGATTTVTLTVTSCPCSGMAGTTMSSTATTATAAAATTTVTSSVAASVTVLPTTTKSVAPSAFTGAAVSRAMAGKDVFGLVIAGVVLAAL